MGDRVDFHYILTGLLGSNYVYFQPPETLKLTYPCIVYQREAEDVKYANNRLYTHKKRYQVTVIDKNPDSEIPDKIRQLPYSSFNRHYTADNLNHDVYDVYY
jgi:hypothetical protein